MACILVQNQKAVPTAAGQVAGEKLTEREAKKAQWLEAQQSSPKLHRPQDQYNWEIDNSNTPFKGMLGHWRHFVKVSCFAMILTLSAATLIQGNLQQSS